MDAKSYMNQWSDDLTEMLCAIPKEIDGLTATDIAVIRQYALYADWRDGSGIKVSRALIAQALHTSEETVKRAMRKARTLNLFTLVNRGYAYRDSTGVEHKNTNEYVANPSAEWKVDQTLWSPEVPASRPTLTVVSPRWDVHEHDDMATILKRNPGIDPDTARRLATDR